MSRIEFPNGALAVNSEVDPTAVLYKNARVTGTRIGENTTVGDFTIIGNSEIGGYVAINRGNLISASRIGFATYTGHNTTIKNTRVGKYCCLSWNLSLGGKNHNFHAATSYPPFHFNRVLEGKTEIVETDFPDTEIGSDVWIGSGATVLRSVRVGDGAVIGAAAVVVKDVPPYAIAVGNPARVIGYRFSGDVIEAMLDLKWWDYSLDVVREIRGFLTAEPTVGSIARIRAAYPRQD